jgi:hypothetical protein
MPTLQDVHWEKNPLTTPLRANLSGLSIYQPGLRRGQGEYPCFAGVYACFLEMLFGVVAKAVNLLWNCRIWCGYMVVLLQKVRRWCLCR